MAACTSLCVRSASNGGAASSLRLGRVRRCLHGGVQRVSRIEGGVVASGGSRSSSEATRTVGVHGRRQVDHGAGRRRPGTYGAHTWLREGTCMLWGLRQSKGARWSGLGGSALCCASWGDHGGLGHKLAWAAGRGQRGFGAGARVACCRVCFGRRRGNKNGRSGSPPTERYSNFDPARHVFDQMAA